MGSFLLRLLMFSRAPCFFNCCEISLVSILFLTFIQQTISCVCVCCVSLVHAPQAFQQTVSRPRCSFSGLSEPPDPLTRLELTAGWHFTYRMPPIYLLAFCRHGNRSASRLLCLTLPVNFILSHERGFFFSKTDLFLCCLKSGWDACLSYIDVGGPRLHHHHNTRTRLLLFVW